MTFGLLNVPRWGERGGVTDLGTFPKFYHFFGGFPKIIFTCVVIKDVCGLAAYWGIFMHKEDTDSIHITTPKTNTNININS